MKRYNDKNTRGLSPCVIGNYSILLRQVKQRVALAQQRAIFAANEELLRMYWDLGQILYKAQHVEGWGKGTLARLSADMKNEYPEEKGFSVRNFQCKNTRGLSPCVLSLLLMVVGMDTAWGYNSGSNYGEFAINTSQF